MHYDASTFGSDGAAIQACIDQAVVDQSQGGARDATVYIPRIRNKKTWVLTEPLRIGPGWQVSLRGDGGGAVDADYGGTILDATGVPGAAIHLQGGTGLTLEKFNIRFWNVGIHFDGDSTQAISSMRNRVSMVGLKSTQSDAVGVLIQGHGSWAEWGGVRLNNDQVASETVFDQVYADVPNGTAFRCASKQAVNVWLEHCSMGGRVGLEVVCGGVHVQGGNFGGPENSSHIVQYGHPQHYSSLTVENTYHEMKAGCRAFMGISSNNRPTHFYRSRFYAQAAGGVWLDAPGMKHLLARDCVFEANSGVVGSNILHKGAVLSRPTYVQW